MAKQATAANIFIAGPSIRILDSKGLDGGQLIIITGGDTSPPGGVVEWKLV